MTIKDVVGRQYRATINRAARDWSGQQRPPEGWIMTTRKALRMSGAQLARRLGVTRARVSQAERAEIDGGITLKSMDAAAQAMGCRFVYAIVPEGRVEDVIAAQARRKANAVVHTAGVHMALESQSLTDGQNKDEVDRVAEDLIRAMPSDFWED